LSHAVEQHPVRAIAYMMGSVFMLSTMDVAFKHLVEHYSSLQVTFMRSALAAPLFAVLILAWDRRLFRTSQWGAHASRAVVGFFMLVAVGEAFRELPLADAYAIFFAAPLLITLLSGPVMKEPAGTFRLVVCGIGFLGVLIVLKPGTVGLISYGSAMCLLAVGCYAVVALMLRAMGRHEHALTIAFWYTLIIGLISGPMLIGRWQSIRTEDWIWLAVLVLAGTIGQLMITAAFRRAPVGVIAPFDYFHMFWAVFYGWWFWGDFPSDRVWLGSVVIVASGLVVIYREQRRGRTPPAVDKGA
jgi:drug/metabolite transporter (DMT)-like permease